MTTERAAQLIGEYINAILKLAPEAGLYIGIKVEPARDNGSRPEGEDAPKSAAEGEARQSGDAAGGNRPTSIRTTPHHGQRRRVG
jgi:hypothetical protein